MARDEYGLTLKQRRFCDSYIELGNATKAAVAAGYSPQSAHVQGRQNLKKLPLVSYMNIAKAEEAKKHNITRETLLHQSLEAYDMAKEQGKAQVMNAVTQTMAKLYGLNEPEKQELNVTEAVTHVAPQVVPVEKGKDND